MQANLSVIRLPGTAAPVHLGVANDITEQRLLERRERETSAQMQAILENVNGGVAAVTVEGGVIRYIFANNEHYAMFGYTREQFERELPRGLLDIIHPDDLPAVRAAVAETQRTGKPMRIEYRARRRTAAKYGCTAAVPAVRSKASEGRCTSPSSWTSRSRSRRPTTSAS